MNDDAKTKPLASREDSPPKPEPGLGRTVVRLVFSRLTFRISRGLLLAYVLVIILLVIFEPSLVYPGKHSNRGDWNPTHFDFEEVDFASADGTRIVAWFLSKPNATRTALICHGNGENVALSSAYMGNEIRDSLNANVLVYDYRGFGKSDGEPFEKGVLEDSEAALKWLNNKTHTVPGEVILIGISIGGGPACYLAEKFGAKSLVLQRTFTSLVAAAQHRYPYIPVSLFMRNRFPSKQRLASYEGPLFQSHGTKDTIVPFEMGKELFECCPSRQKCFYPLPGRGHLDRFPDEYWDALAEFIDGIDP